MLYFWKALDARMSDMIFRVVNHANTKYKYTNTVYIKIPKLTIICTTDGCLTLSPLVSLMYRAKCINPRVNNSPKCILWYSMVYYGMVVCYSVVWYCMVGYGMVWVLTIDGCFLQMGASHPSVESTHL